MGGPAKVLEVAHLRRLISHVQVTRNADRNRVMVLLSFKAGLRAGEIAGLDWRMLLRPDGRLSKQLSIDHRIAKNGQADGFLSAPNCVSHSYGSDGMTPTRLLVPLSDLSEAPT
jgi:integrase